MRTVALSRSALAVPVLLLALVACGGTDAGPMSGEPPARSQAAASPSGHSSPSEQVSEVVESAESPATAPAEGTWDRDTLIPAMRSAIKGQRSAHVSVRTGITGMEMHAEADVAFKGARQDMAMTMDGAAIGADSVEVRLVDRVLYLSVPPLTPRGKFVEVRPGDTSSPLAPMAAQIQVVDPRDTYAALAAGLRKVRFVAEESVHGEDLERYRVTVDFRAVAKAMKMPRTPGAPKTIAYDLWLDEQALVRRVELEMQQVSMVVETSDWGKPVRVEAPARSRIVQAPGQ